MKRRPAASPWRRIRVYGSQRSDVDVDLVAQVLVAISEDLPRDSTPAEPQAPDSEADDAPPAE